MEKPYILPAEWYPQSAIQLTWPHDRTDWKPYLQDITKTFIELANTITCYETLFIVTQDIDETLRILETNLTKKQLNKIKLFQCPTNDTWARDHGPITLINKNEKKDVKLLNFKFNGWGNKFPSDLDNRINNNIEQAGIFNGEMITLNDFVLEGGSIESDGEGTIFTTSQCLLAPHRNQPLSQDAIEKSLKRMLYADRIIWLNHGSLIGDDTDGHIDTIVRPAPNNTILYVGCDNKADEQYDDFKALENQLKSLRNNEGKPYKLIKLPMPDALFEEGKRLPATYANFVIINGCVICPTYNQKEKDSEAIEILHKAFPDRDVIGIDARTVVKQHGSLHCLTMQYPQGAICPTTQL